MRISDWSSDVCSSDLYSQSAAQRADCAFLFDINVLSALEHGYQTGWLIFRQMLNAGAPGGKASEVQPQPAYYAREKPIAEIGLLFLCAGTCRRADRSPRGDVSPASLDRKSTRLNSSH